MDTFNKIKYHFQSVNLYCEEIQANYFGGGLDAGYVTYMDGSTDEHYEISFDDAVHWVKHNGTKYDILKDSELDKEYYS